MKENELIIKLTYVDPLAPTCLNVDIITGILYAALCLDERQLIIEEIKD